jgi:hypothetical protein
MNCEEYSTKKNSSEILKHLRGLEQTAQEKLERLYDEYNFLDGFCRKRDEPEARRSADHNTQMRAFLDIRRAARQAIEAVHQGNLAGMGFRVKMLANALQKAPDSEMAELFLRAKDAGQADLLKIAHEKKQEISLSQSAKEFRQRKAAFTKFVRSAKDLMAASLLIQQRKQSARRTIVSPRLLVRARSYRRSRHVATVNSGGGDDDGQGDPPEPPRQAPPVIPNKLSDSNSFPSPWPGHGCFYVGGWSV